MCIQKTFNKIIDRQTAWYSKTELSEKLDLDRGTISKYEKGESYPTLPTIIKLTEILDTNINDLLGVPCKIPAVPDKEIEYFSSKTGLSQPAIRILYKNSIEEISEKDVMALDYLIRYNTNTDDGVSVLRCLYEAIRLPKLSITEILRKKVFTDGAYKNGYYSDDNIFLKNFLGVGAHIHMSDIYLLLFYKKIDYIVKEKIWKNIKRRKKQREKSIE